MPAIIKKPIKCRRLSLTNLRGYSQTKNSSAKSIERLAKSARICSNKPHIVV
jgi:hypothetical protein